jgi:hypothetical protein
VLAIANRTDCPLWDAYARTTRRTRVLGDVPRAADQIEVTVADLDPPTVTSYALPTQQVGTPSML